MGTGHVNSNSGSLWHIQHSSGSRLWDTHFSDRWVRLLLERILSSGGGISRCQPPDWNFPASRNTIPLAAPARAMAFRAGTHRLAGYTACVWTFESHASLAHLDEIPTPRCLVIALPLKLAGGSGSPVRVVYSPLEFILLSLSALSGGWLVKRLNKSEVT